MRNLSSKPNGRRINHFSANRFLLFKRSSWIPFTITVILTWLALFQLKAVLADLGVMVEGNAWISRYRLIQFAAAALNAILLSLLLLEGFQGYIQRWLTKLTGNPFLQGIWFVLTSSVLLSLLYLFYGPFNYLNNGFFIRALFAWMLFCLIHAMFIAVRKFQSLRLEQKVIFDALAAAVVITLATTFCRINGNPLSATWSEGSVLYFASSFVSRFIYGQQIGLPVINPGRALLQSFPFLIPGPPITAHRIWDAVLWITLPLLTGYVLVKRLKVKEPFQALSLIFFSLLYLNLGPAYYHLLAAGLIVLIGFRSGNFGRSLVIVIIASLWAGLTRINWFPIPGSLAAILYWLETPGSKNIFGDVWKPIVWFIAGFTVSVFSNQLYIQISGTPAEYFENPFSTPLLWERLFPTATNPLGILPAILLVTLPGLIYAAIYFFRSASYSWIRRAGIFTLLTAFFLGGFLVSVRIGGGNNLHNFDAYLLILLILFGYIYFGKIRTDVPASPVIPKKIHAVVIVLLLILPLLKPILKAPTFPTEITKDEFQAFLTRVEDDTRLGKSVLMLDDAHLLAFDYWEIPPELPEFNKVFLSEAAITGNRAYLDAYYSALSAQKYDYIVAEPLTPYFYGSDHPFDEETDAWIQAVEKPTLCYYEVIYSFKELGLDYLAPRETVCETNFLN